jgi:hypothetical protein
MSSSTETNIHDRKIKRRGFVMTGGGAKGFYEAGVIHALHISGMEFDVITGSSIGAINSVFYAEYLYRKRQLSAKVRKDPLRTIEQMDNLIKAYHHAWLQLPDKKLIDDTEAGPLGKLKNDLQRFNLDLPQIVRLGWWWSDPGHAKLPPVGVWTSLVGLGKELIERLGGSQELLRIIKNNRTSPVREVARTYLGRFGMDRSLVPPQDDHKLRDIFTQPGSPLQIDHLLGNVSAPDSQGAERFVLIDPERTLRDYYKKDIAVRLTRANYRTGRLEISAWIEIEDFVRFMQKQAWKLKAFGPDKLPLGNFRLQVPGNPNAINAALCSGRFPGVFMPYRIEDIYPASDPENLFLSKLLSHWLADQEIETSMAKAYHAINKQASSDKWGQDYSEWRDPTGIGDFFPQAGDTYVDGGAIDNTPTSSAVDFIREWVERNKLSRREVVLDLFVIFLDTEPKVDPDKARAPTIFEVVARTLAIQGAAKRSSDANTVGTINAFGQHGEELGKVLQALLENYRETLGSLDPTKAHQAQERLRERVRTLLIRDLSGKIDQAANDMILDQIDQWSEKVISSSLPIHVNVIKIYPEKMPLDTLQFTERLGYRKENAIQMLTMGCYNTLTALRRHLEQQKQQDMDAQDQLALTLVQKWMGNTAWPESIAEQGKFCREWLCQRKACVFHSGFCLHGDSQPKA